MKACPNEKDKANYQALIDKEKAKAPPPDAPTKKRKRSQGRANSRRHKVEKAKSVPPLVMVGTKIKTKRKQGRKKNSQRLAKYLEQQKHRVSASNGDIGMEQIVKQKRHVSFKDDHHFSSPEKMDYDKEYY
jgi:hypothetical protein